MKRVISFWKDGTNEHSQEFELDIEPEVAVLEAIKNKPSNIKLEDGFFIAIEVAEDNGTIIKSSFSWIK